MYSTTSIKAIFNIRKLKANGDYGDYINSFSNQSMAEDRAKQFTKNNNELAVVIYGNLCEVYRTKLED